MFKEIVQIFRRSRIGDRLRWSFEPKKVMRYIINRLPPIGGSCDYRKFIVLTRARTGSNLLIDLLYYHPQIFARSEILRRLAERDFQTILGKKVFFKHPKRIKAAGFKIFYKHPLDAERKLVWEWLGEQKELKVIHLIRKNILRSVVSYKIAEANDFWYQKKESKLLRLKADCKRVFISARELENEFRQTVEWQNWGREFFSDHPFLEISYEELTGEEEETFFRVCDFLGVERRRSASSFKKQNPEKLSELIENYSELKAEFSGTEFAHFFDE